MFKYYFEQIQNVAIWPVISLAIFFGFFILLIWWLIKVDRRYIDKMKNLPLDEDENLRQGRSKKKIIAVLVGLLVPMFTFGQETGVASTWDQETVLLWVLILVIVIALLVLMVAIYTLSVLQVALNKTVPAPATKKERWWEHFWDRFNKSVPREKEADVLLDHNYDGIRELDNHLPPWWTATFYLSIIIGIVYMLVYHVFESAPLPAEIYETEMAMALEAKSERLAEAGAETGAIDEASVTFDGSEAVLVNGKTVYDRQCAPCHRDDGGGSIGPNLTDAYWINGGSVSDIFKTIKYGVPQKGMIPWEPLLSPVQMRDVTSYIISLAGSEPVDAKAQQGDLYEAPAE